MRFFAHNSHVDLRATYMRVTVVHGYSPRQRSGATSAGKANLGSEAARRRGVSDLASAPPAGLGGRVARPRLATGAHSRNRSRGCSAVYRSTATATDVDVRMTIPSPCGQGESSPVSPSGVSGWSCPALWGTGRDYWRQTSSRDMMAMSSMQCQCWFTGEVVARLEEPRARRRARSTSACRGVRHARAGMRIQIRIRTSARWRLPASPAPRRPGLRACPC